VDDEAAPPFTSPDDDSCLSSLEPTSNLSIPLDSVESDSSLPANPSLDVDPFKAAANKPPGRGSFFSLTADGGVAAGLQFAFEEEEEGVVEVDCMGRGGGATGLAETLCWIKCRRACFGSALGSSAGVSLAPDLPSCVAPVLAPPWLAPT
jgi:hypothetical protein